ncbi:site-specific recombinase XerD [Pelomonas aquatica]|uniref:Site-specific recombinase XerD n=1 Tax=Pelomonas aquatica TaxID=431058 RepID=A0ABU1Z6U9_9BURK|nr:tyrosine-type recombinase/integrase [Pelomonas aquatica]MDR7296335.1 site-specific recombinase XerD [Pelomonas aquatica]
MDQSDIEALFSARPKPLKDYLRPSLTTVNIDGRARSLALLSQSSLTIDLELTGAPQPILCVADSNGFIVRTVSAWLSHIGRQIGHSTTRGTVGHYGKTMSYLVRWIEKHPPMPNLSVDENILCLNRDDVLNWLDDMKAHGAKSTSTRHSREVCLYEFLDWLCTDDARNLRDMDHSPRGRDGKLGTITKKGGPKSPKYIDTQLVVSLLASFHNECERCMFHAQYDMGLRISELISLTLRDLPDDSRFDPSLEFIPICINGVKGRAENIKQRITLMSRAVLRRIKSYHNTIEYQLAAGWDFNDLEKPVFLTANQFKWQARNATKQFNAAAARAGLDEGIRPHWLRHGTAFSVLMSDEGKDYIDRMLIVQRMLGHSNLKTTEIYTQISPAMLDKLTKAGRRLNRLKEAETIRSESWLAPLRHKEHRGHIGK